MVTVKSL